MAKMTIEEKIHKLSQTVCKLHNKLEIYSNEAKTMLLISNVIYQIEKGNTQKFNNAIKKLEEHASK
jgi:hypothetical protein